MSHQKRQRKRWMKSKDRKGGMETLNNERNTDLKKDREEIRQQVLRKKKMWKKERKTWKKKRRKIPK